MKTDPAPDLARWTSSRRQWIEQAFEARLPARATGDDPGRLVEAMRYSLLAPGKRLRPLLALAAAEAVTGQPGSAAGPIAPANHPVVIAAASVELIHCYSLIHDDLPAMDDDDFRRGKPSNHKVFGEATAILAGDALLTLAFEWLADAGAQAGRPADFGRAVLALARGAGMNGMVRGQARDLGEPVPNALPDLEQLHDEKTAALFRAAAEVGAAAAGGTAGDITAVGTFGQRFGVAFQHADDREDGDHPAHAVGVLRRIPDLIEEAISGLQGLANPARGATLAGIARDLLHRVIDSPAVGAATVS
ncbi:MAG: polyprenyl synthetase family protein [Myxococcales bacterium]